MELKLFVNLTLLCPCVKRRILSEVKLLEYLVLYFNQFVIFKPISYCFEETIGFDVKASFASRPVSRLIRWYIKPGDITKEFWEKVISWIENYKLQCSIMNNISETFNDSWKFYFSLFFVKIITFQNWKILVNQ